MMLVKTIFIGCFNILIASAIPCMEEVSFSNVNTTTVKVESSSNDTYSIVMDSSFTYSLSSFSILIITDLCPEVNYTFNISTNNDTCQHVHIINGTIENLHIEFKNSTSVIVSWDKPFGGSYRVSYSNHTHDIHEEVYFDSSQFLTSYSVNVTVGSLCPQVLYQFNVSLVEESQLCPVFTEQETYKIEEDLTSVVTNAAISSKYNTSIPPGIDGRLVLYASWKAPENVSCSVVEYKVMVNQTKTSTTNLSLSDSNVFPNMLYSITITPVTSVGDGKALLQTHHTDTDVPWDAPKSFQIVADGPGGINFTWSDPEFPNTNINNISYLLFVTREDSTVINRTYNHGTFSGNFGSLHGYERVCAFIIAINENGSGPISNTTCGHAPESESGPVSNLIYSILTASSIALSWDPPINPYGIVSGYNVTVSYSDFRNSRDEMFVEAGRTLAQIENLDPKEMYDVSVAVMNSYGVGVLTTIKIFSIQDELPVFSNVKAERTSNNSFLVTWTKLLDFQASIIIYKLEYYSNVLLDNNYIEKIFISPNHSSWNVTGVNEFTSYNVRITALSNQGIGVSETTVPVSTYFNLTEMEERILQIRFYGNLNCQENNETLSSELLKSLSKQLMKYCECENSLLELDTRSILLCMNNINAIILRISTKKWTLGNITAWIQSPNPFIVVNRKLLVADATQSCPLFINTFDSQTCFSCEGNSCAGAITGAITGTFFSALLLGLLFGFGTCLLIYCKCRSQGSDSSKLSTIRELFPSPKEHYQDEHTYENVGQKNVKLNSQSVLYSRKTTSNTYIDLIEGKNVNEMEKNKSTHGKQHMDDSTKREVKVQTKPKIKPKPKLEFPGGIKTGKNTAYNPTSGDECSKRIQAVIKTQ